MYEISEEEFEQAIENAVEAIPSKFLDQMENVCIVAEDEPSPEDFATVRNPKYPTGTRRGVELLGLYHGVNITRRSEYYQMVEPDMITIFKGPHERVCNSYEQLITQIAKTVIHEIGHYFGLDDDRLHEIGY